MSSTGARHGKECRLPRLKLPVLETTISKTRRCYENLRTSSPCLETLVMYACFFCCNSSYLHSEGTNRSGRVPIGSCDFRQRCRQRLLLQSRHLVQLLYITCANLSSLQHSNTLEKTIAGLALLVEADRKNHGVANSGPLLRQCN